MNEPWISQQTLGLLIMLIFIPLGPLVGTLGWLFVQNGKAKKLTLGVIAFGFVMGLVFIVFGVIAYLFGQPRWVWLRSGFYGLDCAILFGIVYWLILKRYWDAELRKTMSEDLTLVGKEVSPKDSNEE